MGLYWAELRAGSDRLVDFPSPEMRLGSARFRLASRSEPSRAATSSSRLTSFELFFQPYSGWRCTKMVANTSPLQMLLLVDVAVEIAAVAIAVEDVDVVQVRAPATVLLHQRRTQKSSARSVRRLAMKLLGVGTVMMMMKMISQTTGQQELLLQDMV